MNDHVRNKRRYLSLVMVLMLGLSVLMPVNPLRVYAEDNKTTQQEKTKDELSAKLLLNTEDNKENYDPHQHAVIDSEDAFTDDDTLSFTEMDGNQISDSVEKTEKETGNEDFTVLKGWSLSVAPEKDEKQDHTCHVSLYVDDIDAYKKKETELYHIDEDKVEKLDFAVAEDNSDPDHPEEYLSFQTDSLSSFLFIVKNSTGGGNTGTAETPQPSVTPETTPAPVTTPKPSSEPEKSQTQNEKDIHTARELKTGDFKLKAGSFKKASPAPQADDSHIQSFTTELFYGAEKQKDGTYVWNVPETTDEYKAGHRFIFRLNYTLNNTAGEVTPADAIHITVPQHILKDRNRNDADTMEWSIPSQQEVQAATDENGNIDDSKISKNINFAYYSAGNNYVIYNFRSFSNLNNGYIELAYLTSKSSFDYKDMDNNPYTFNAAMSYQTEPEQRTKNILVEINTVANLTSVMKRAPYSREKTWNESWGNAGSFDITDPTQYYYLIWDVKSVVNATQPYSISFIDNMTSNKDGMRVLGYRFSGQQSFSKSSSLPESRQKGERWDQVLTAIPLSVYQNENYWQAINSISVTVTPNDGKDQPKTKKSSATWTWSKPVFKEQGANFNSYKRGDGASRAGYVFDGTTHRASTLDFKAGEYTRYDLEEFNGYDAERNTTDPNPSLKTFDGFDFASWAVGFPNSSTVSGSAKSHDDYWKTNVKYVLTDGELFLLNDEKALKSSNGSTRRTIDNESIDAQNGTAAIKLEYGDYRIDKLEYSWLMNDAIFDEETQTFRQTASVTYDANETVTFEGQFNGSKDWVTFATYDLNNKIFNPVDTYVESMDNRSVTFKNDQDLTAYRVSTSNHHYYTELYTVPFYSLKNSDRVMNLLRGHDKMLLLNNNNLTVYNESDHQIFSSDHSDTDYACVSQKKSSLTKNVVSTSNNNRQGYFTITWRVIENEIFKTGQGTETYIPQQSGVFYDLLPDGAQLDQDTVDVRIGNSPGNPSYGSQKLDSSSYDVKTISNYQNTGRTLLIVSVKEPGDHFIVTYDTQHSWDSIADYGSNVTNPVVYETGNDKIYHGVTGNDDSLKDLKNVAVNSEMSARTDQTKYLYSQNTWDIKAITSGSTGFSKRVKLDSDKQYGTSAEAHINENYSYEIRFMNNFGHPVNNIVFYDSLENYEKDGDTSSWRWKGSLQSIDLSQLKKLGISPNVYISTNENVDPETQHDLHNKNFWTPVTDETDLSQARAIAVDVGTKSDNTPFSLDTQKSLVFHLYMKAPAQSPDNTTEAAGLPCAYNNAYMRYQLKDAENPESIHQDYTTVSLRVTGNAYIHKTSEADGNPIKGISFHLYGTSAYKNDVNAFGRTDVNGNLGFKDVEEGTYTLQESDATEDYLLDPTEHKVVINHDGSATIDDTPVTEAEPKVITNKPRIHADVRFVKIDSISARKLTGAQYKLSGTSGYGTNVLMTADSDDGGTVNFSNVEKGTYTLKEVKAPSDSDKKGQGDYILDPTEYKVLIDDSGYCTISRKAKPRYSHTENIDDDGNQNGNYEPNWGNRNIRGTGRTKADSHAHVITIPGAEKLHVRLKWGTQHFNRAYVSIWDGSHPDVNASTDYTSANQYNSNGYNYTQKIGGSSLGTSGFSGTYEFDVNGDSVTFSFCSTNYSYVGDGYGYYAVITADIDEEVEKSGNTYILKDEPLHSFSFVKKSSYDQSLLEGAEFSLAGTSDTGTSVNKTAVSQKDTGTVRFGNLETGTYILQETQAPEGYTKDDNQYVVKITSDGKFTIDNLLQDTGGVYQMFNIKNAEKQITITKIWDDGIDHTDPDDLSITLSVDVPEAKNRGYTIRYHSNEGTFADGSVINEVHYNTFNIPDGNEGYKAPIQTDFIGWFDDKDKPFGVFDNYQWFIDPDDPSSAEEAKKVGLTYQNMNAIKNGQTIDLYAKYYKMKYAVMLYGIGQDTDENNEKMGLTFGPATGDDYNNGFIAHEVDDETKIQFENETYPSNSHNVIVDKKTKEPLGTDEKGNAYRCIHYDNWQTIVYWNREDPHVYDKCVQNNCTHSVELDLSKAPGVFNGQFNMYGSGDGTGGLYDSFKDGVNPTWNMNYTDDMNYAGSRVRAILNGSDQYTKADNAGEDATGFTADDSILSTFPDILKQSIGKKKVEYAPNKITHNSNEVVYDKLWLLSDREIYGNDTDSFHAPIYQYDEGRQYERFSNRVHPDNGTFLHILVENSSDNAGLMTRSLAEDGLYSGVGDNGLGGAQEGVLLTWKADYYNPSISPCFSLSRSSNTAASPKKEAGK